MPNLTVEKTNAGEALNLLAETIGQALAKGLSAFEDEYPDQVDPLLGGVVVSQLSILIGQQLSRPDGARTLVKTYEAQLPPGVDGDFVKV